MQQPSSNCHQPSGGIAALPNPPAPPLPLLLRFPLLLFLSDFQLPAERFLSNPFFISFLCFWPSSWKSIMKNLCKSKRTKPEAIDRGRGERPDLKPDRRTGRTKGLTGHLDIWTTRAEQELSVVAVDSQLQFVSFHIPGDACNQKISHAIFCRLPRKPYKVSGSRARRV